MGKTLETVLEANVACSRQDACRRVCFVVERSAGKYYSGGTTTSVPVVDDDRANLAIMNTTWRVSVQSSTITVIVIL